MDNRLIFRYRRNMDAVTQKDRQSVAMVDHVQAVRLLRSEVRATEGWAVMGNDYDR